MPFKNFYITTPIYYVNDVPHIGHAYTTLICDALARFMKLKNIKVKFITGTDEHGQKVEKAAISRKVSTQEFVDKNSEVFQELLKVMNYSNDDFIRTTSEDHKQAVSFLWQRLYDNKHIYLGSYQGWYSVRDEAFYQEKELIDGKAPTGAPVEWIEEPSYFFNLSKWQDKLLELYENNPEFIVPSHRRNEVISFVKSGLKDLSISRQKFSWGIKVPNDNSHVIYVWLDALTNYLTAVGFPNKECDDYKTFWDNKDALTLHVVGKDILRFHAIYWPAFLMAADLPLPKQILAHGWWTNEGEKISKSLGNVIDPFALVKEFGVDPIRYFFLKEISIGNDGNFSRANLISCINSDLSNNIGNLIQRTVAFIHKECNGVIPKVNASDFQSLINYDDINNKINSHITKYELNEVIFLISKLASQANEYIDKNAPWKLSKSNRDLMNIVLYNLLEYIKCIGILLQPIIPQSADAILNQIALPHNKRSFSSLSLPLISGTQLPVPVPIFAKFKT